MLLVLTAGGRSNHRRRGSGVVTAQGQRQDPGQQVEPGLHLERDGEPGPGTRGPRQQHAGGLGGAVQREEGAQHPSADGVLGVIGDEGHQRGRARDRRQPDQDEQDDEQPQVRRDQRRVPGDQREHAEGDQGRPGQGRGADAPCHQPQEATAHQRPDGLHPPQQADVLRRAGQVPGDEEHEEHEEGALGDPHQAGHHEDAPQDPAARDGAEPDPQVRQHRRRRRPRRRAGGPGPAPADGQQGGGEQEGDRVGDDHRLDAAEAVDQTAQRAADQSGQAGADAQRGVERQPVLGGHLGAGGGLPRGLDHRAQHRLDHHDHVHEPQLVRGPDEQQRQQHERLDHGDHRDQPPAVEPVDQHAGERSQHHHRQQLEHEHRRRDEGRPGEVEHEQRQRDEQQPVPDLRGQPRGDEPSDAGTPQDAAHERPGTVSSPAAGPAGVPTAASLGPSRSGSGKARRVTCTISPPAGTAPRIGRT